ncbi:hypothetical protein RRF57_004915 [Xylaria bambusicola]|uniref:Uncharacterized protein n=1 Tax=Xylaria bambusicola TaxID=326684 RepID=A0AAN7UBH0_9PEZI
MDPTVVQSAERPVLSNERCDLVKMLDDGASMDEIFEKLINGPLVKCIVNEKWFTDDKDIMNELFLSISRGLLRCLLVNNLGPDLWDKALRSRRNWENNIYDIDGPGAYVMFTFVRDRGGKWLSKREIRELISLLDMYRDAIKIWERRNDSDIYGTSQLIDGQKDVLKMAMKIDDAVRSVAQYPSQSDDEIGRFEPRFKSSTAKDLTGYINAMIDMLRRRCLSGVDRDIYQCQSPLMVGNAGDMARRTSNHMSGNSFHQSPKLWGLMLSCLAVMKINVETQAVPLFRAWTDGNQVNVAEVLATVLAGSMVSVAGLNVKQPGTRFEEGRTSQNAYENGKFHVFAAKPWLNENLELCIARQPHNVGMAKEIKAAEEKLEVLQREESDLKEEIRAAREERHMAREEFNSCFDSLQKMVGEGRRELKELVVKDSVDGSSVVVETSDEASTGEEVEEVAEDTSE